MITRKEDLPVTVRKHARGGKGEVTQWEMLSPDHWKGHGRFFAHMKLEPGCSVGYHEHNGDSETFYILQGTALFNDNGQQVTLHAGDCSYTGSGQGHSIENIGDDTLEYIALIIND